jgi:hypothetical protein
VDTERKMEKKRVDNLGMGRDEFDQIVKSSILDSVRMVGDDYLDLVLSFLESRSGTRVLDPQHLQDVDIALDSVFLRFSTAIKYIIIFQICATLKLEPQNLGKSLEWAVHELRSYSW